MLYRIIFAETNFHGFHFFPGFVWGKTEGGEEFAASGWSNDDGTEYFVYRRQADGTWRGRWELAVPDDCGNYWNCPKQFYPASDVAQLLSYIAQ